MERDLTWVLDILQRARLIQQFTAGLDETAFMHDVLRREAVIRQIEVMGEAVRRVSEDFCAAHTEIPWSKIAGMRNRLIHEYDRIDLVAVWKTVVDDIPVLIEHLEKILPPDGDPENA